MSIAVIWKLLHILSAIWFMCGLVGRSLSLSNASRSRDANVADALVQLGGRFERLMVIPGSLAVFIMGLFTAWAQGWPVLGFLQGGSVNWVLVSLLLYLSLVPVIIWIFLPRGKLFEKAMQDALAQGKVTTELTAAFSDKVVDAAHKYELVSTALIVILMVLKPF